MSMQNQTVTVPADTKALLTLEVVTTSNTKIANIRMLEATVRDTELDVLRGNITFGSYLEVEQGEYFVEWPEITGTTVTVVAKEIPGCCGGGGGDPIDPVEVVFPTTTCEETGPVTTNDEPVDNGSQPSWISFANFGQDGGVHNYTGLPFNFLTPDGANTAMTLVHDHTVPNTPECATPVAVTGVQYRMVVSHASELNDPRFQVALGSTAQGSLLCDVTGTYHPNPVNRNGDNSYTVDIGPGGVFEPALVEILVTVTDPSTLTLSQAYELDMGLILQDEVNWSIWEAERTITYQVDSECFEQVLATKDCNSDAILQGVQALSSAGRCTKVGLREIIGTELNFNDIGLHFAYSMTIDNSQNALEIYVEVDGVEHVVDPGAKITWTTPDPATPMDVSGIVIYDADAALVSWVQDCDQQVLPPLPIPE